jgi:hypothetical protein
MQKKEKEQRKADSIKFLRTVIKQGDRVYTGLQHVSSSGMSRRIKVYVPVKQERENNGMAILDISWHVANALEYRFSSNYYALVVGGCGMDMGYHVVYTLARVLFRDDFTCIGDGCPSNDHVNGDKVAQGEQHSDAGYSLTHSWL